MLVTHANTNGVWPHFLVWSPPWLYASSVRNKNINKHVIFTNAVHTKITSVLKNVLIIGIFQINLSNIELSGQRNCTMCLKFATCKVEKYLTKGRG